MDYKEYLQSEQWQKRRNEALINDGFRCKICKSEENLNVHHLTYERLGEEKDEDLIVLCERCHSKWHKIEKHTSLENVDFSTDAEIILEKSKKGYNFLDGISTGYKKLDEMTSGFNSSDLVVLAGRPSMGKTSFALNIARNISLDYGIPVGYFSLETTIQNLVFRLICTESKINPMAARTGKLTKSEQDRLKEQTTKILDIPLYINDNLFDIYDILTNAYYLKEKKNIELLFIDYLQLINIKNNNNALQEMDSNLRLLKNISIELDIPIVLLSQVSRNVESRDKSKKPVLSDLKGSGSIEEIADLILFLYRPEYYGIMEFEDTGQSTHNMCEVLISKQRNGPTGSSRLTYLKEFGKFGDPDIFAEFNNSNDSF